jgi:hypothetical protein
VFVHAEGMPAIDPTGRLVATSHEQWLQLSSFPGMTTLRIIARDGGEDQTVPIVPAGADPSTSRSCRALRAQVRKDIGLANHELVSRGFRAMESLAVEYGNTETPEEDQAHDETPPHERALQVIVQHGEAIVRIPGVKVYERHPVAAPNGNWLSEVHGDRETGTVVLTLAECQGDSCTCDPMFTSVVMHWDEDTFAALDAHPCTDPEAEDGRCSGIDYGL